MGLYRLKPIKIKICTVQNKNHLVPGKSLPIWILVVPNNQMVTVNVQNPDIQRSETIWLPEKPVTL
jgi:hypothetical protein